MPQIIMTHKNITAAVRLAVLAALGVATTVLAVDLAKLPPPSTQKGVTYAKDIQPIFKANCFDCHAEKVHKNDLRLDSLAAALKGSRDNSDVIVPGKSDKSDLVINICWEAGPEHPMPPKPRGPRGGPRGPGANNAPAAGAQPQSPQGPGGPGMGGPVRKELTPEQIGLIRAWIDQGAK
jgi:cytochrome c